MSNPSVSNWNLDVNRIDWKVVVIIILVIILILYIFGVFNKKTNLTVVRPFTQMEDQNQYQYQY